MHMTRDDIVFYGSRVDAGDLTRETAALLLLDVSYHRVSIAEARQAIDTWQAYQGVPAPAPAVLRAFLRRLFTRKHRTTNPKETPTR